MCVCVPVRSICAEQLDAAHKAGVDVSAGKEIAATSLRQFETNFDAFLKRSENTIRGERIRAKGSSMDF